jgi:AraC-like DNA-binding protein
MVLAENALWGTEAKTQIPVALESMMSYIRSNIGSSLTVAEVAGAGDLSPTSAQRLFNSHTGVSLRTWIRQLRLQEAAHLLRNSGLRVNEIGKMLGFSDPLYFSRVFREEHGISPSQYAQSELRP